MVSIIILSYNTKQLLFQCLESVYKHVKFKHEVIVVDNDSQDGSTTMVKKEFSSVRLIKNKENLGFSKACNIGAAKSRGEYLLFLNSDTIINDNSVSRLLKEIEKDKEIAVVGGMLRNLDGTQERSFGNDYNLLNLAVMLFGGDKLEKKLLKVPENPSEVGWVSGGCMLVRKETFSLLNGFDERFFMYFEDVEFCYRCRKLGKKVIFNPHSLITHLGQGSSNRSFAIEQIYKGAKYFYEKHRSAPEVVVAKALLYQKAFIALIFAMIKGRTSTVETYRKALKTI